LSSEAWFEVLRSGQEDLDTLSDSRGMAIRIHWAGWKILVMGDLGVEEEREMMASGIDLSADSNQRCRCPHPSDALDERSPKAEPNLHQVIC
ncbi:hypothetical protein OAK86_03785, partial [Akkermansiaceae bacterium]|nr:hypothetical protein [Akkermansiaceae bacterium]